ncbi:MAG TPA: hypothetical protein VNM45_08950 [Bacillus sp. (in: firmicutes)]|nr:hypothetical protein [Bacillus sp. (in: firmicutes)]
MKKIMVLFLFLFFIESFPVAGETESTITHDEHLYVFLEMTQQEFDSLWQEGKSVAEIAESKGISEKELLHYLLDKEVEAMRSALNSGELSHVQYIQNILRLKETLLHKIHGNPHQENESKKVSNEKNER